MSVSGTWQIEITDGAADLLRQAEVQLERIFEDGRIRVWRDLPERQNCYLDLSPGTGTPARLHIKRYKPPHGGDAGREVEAIRMLEGAGIPTVPLLAWGKHGDGRAFLITADLTGYGPADRVLADEGKRAAFTPAIAELAAKLHGAGLHHQDLYLCHFFIRPDDAKAAVHLIDPGRVSRLGAFPGRIRWIVKDLAQLCYSAQEAGWTEEEIGRLLDGYFAREVPGPGWVIRGLIPWKVGAIARHDRRLRRRRPGRRVSIDGDGGKT